MQEIQPQVTGFGWQDRFQNMMQHPIVRIIVQLVILTGSRIRYQGVCSQTGSSCADFR